MKGPVIVGYDEEMRILQAIAAGGLNRMPKVKLGPIARAWNKILQILCPGGTTHVKVHLAGDPSVGIPPHTIHILGISYQPSWKEQMRKDLGEFFSTMEDDDRVTVEFPDDPEDNCEA